MRTSVIGPIEHWWDENWETPEHWRYVQWRSRFCDALVERLHLVYRPHEAFKGWWVGNNGDAFAQVVNDTALLACHVIFNLRPDGIPAKGTEREERLCEDHSKIVIQAPPPGWPETTDDADGDADAIRAYIEQAEGMLAAVATVTA